MQKIDLFDNAEALKIKFHDWFQHRKKLYALDNYSLVEKFEHKNYLELIRECLDMGFLGDKESEFLGYMLDRYELQYLDWCQRTKWLDRKLQVAVEKREKAQKVETQQFDLFRDHAPTKLLIDSIKLEVATQQPGAAAKWK